MHRTILEARVISAVSHVLGGGRIEDDLIEVKSQWPDDLKKFARQFAGLANRAAGSDIILILGVDEDAHRLTPLDNTGPEDWWPGIEARFVEGSAPEPVNNLVVPLPDGGSVVAWAFETDGAPYVVKNPEGNAPHYEVPIRRGTATGWARRSDLIRMLARRVHTPNVIALADSHLNFTWYAEKDPADGKHRDEFTSVYASLFVFVEHLASDYVMFPQHAMTASLDAGGHVVSFKVRPPYRPTKGAEVPPPSPHGVEARDDGLLVTGPGRAFFRCDTSIRAVEVSRKEIEQLESAVVNLVLPVTGSDVPARLAFNFRRVKPAKAGDAFQASLGNFVLDPN